MFSINVEGKSKTFHRNLIYEVYEMQKRIKKYVLKQV